LRKLSIAIGVTSTVAAVAVAIVYFLILSGSSEPTPEQRATAESLERYELRIEPRVWRQIEIQPWFNKGNPTPEGLRLINLISEYYVSQRAFDAIKVVETYPDGLDGEYESLLLGLELGELIRTVVIAPWFVDGITEPEAAYLTVLGDAWKRKGSSWTFDDLVLASAKKPWFQDGLDEKEAAVLNAAAALSGRNHAKAIKLVEGLESDVFLYENVSLPLSGEKTLIITAAPGVFEAQISPALALVKRWIIEVEALSGPYSPRYILVSIEDLNSLCGTGSGGRGDIPGFVTLDIACVSDSTVIHELAHVFVGSGPIWFAEGIADVYVLHLTGRNGNYLAFQASGKVKISYHHSRSQDYPPDYREQGALGAKLLADVYRLIGPDQTFTIVRQIIADTLPREGPLLRDLFLAGTPDNLKSRLTALYTERFENQ